MTSKSLICLRKGLAISLMAAVVLVAALPGYATPISLDQANSNENGSSQPDVRMKIEQADKLRSEGKYSDAAVIWRQLLAVAEKYLDQNDPVIAHSLNNLAWLLKAQGDYNAAEPLYRRALSIREKALGPEHPDVAKSLNNLAVLQIDLGRYSAAELMLYHSLAIREKALGPDHPDVGDTLNNLAGLLGAQGKYSAAEPIYRRALSIQEKVLGPDHPDVGDTLNNLAGLYRDQGKHSASGPMLYRSLAIREKSLGPDHPDIANSLNNVAGLLSVQGQDSAAEPLYRRALSIREKALGQDHPDVANSLNNLAGLLRRQGKHAEAEFFQRRSLKIYEEVYSQEHPFTATSLNNLAGLLDLQGQNSAAEILYRRALSIREKALGQDHPDVANSLNNLAGLLRRQGKHAEAEFFQRRSLGIQKKVLGDDHPTIAITLSNLAGLLSHQGQFMSAVSVLNDSLAIEATWLIRELPLLSDGSRSFQLRQLGNAWESTFGMIDRHPPAAKLALETRLNRQGLLQEIEQRQALLLNAPGVDRIKVEQLQALTQQLASVSLSPDRRTIVREQRDKLQSEVYRQIPDLQLQLVNTSAVAKALPADGALVEFQRYRPFDGRNPKGQRWGAAQYIALVIKPNGSINAVPLGPAAAIDATVHKGLRASADGLSDAESIWAQLSSQVLKPLLPQLSGSRQWFLSPDGELNRVPFAALPAPQEPGKTLAQAVQLRLLTTGRELARLQQPTPPGSAALVMANPNYDRPSTKQPQAVRHDAVATLSQRRSAELDSNQWKPLLASELEGHKVAKLLNTWLISGAAATTTALQRQQGPRVLHVATHGFFVADQEANSPEGLKAIQEGSPLLRSLRQEDPQLRSGLVFAGANQPEFDPNDDGYLTAAEAVTLNLKGTELVVLSACSTGQGEVRTGEGVYGLQRSLTVAGARSTLLSLWKVDDAATAEFMDRYYQRLKAGEGRSDALASVQQEFRSGKVQSPSGTNWKEPYYWAAWQLVGDWRPIKGL
jgi:CHAT domain-containing protein/tetratricopeptide (TPR) repeat protein